MSVQSAEHPTVVKNAIETKLKGELQPSFLQVENESHMHSVPPGSESHFKVTVVSDSFDGKRPVARHQLVYGVLAEEVQGPVHALALHTYTAKEWEAQGQSPDSPNCMGGSKQG